jgi:hypothetical protein
MKDNAHQVPGSTRSCRTALSRLFPFAASSLLSSIRPENRSKIGQKSVHFRECDFFKCSSSTIYNSDPLKSTDFLVTRSHLPIDNPGPLAQTCGIRAILMVDGCLFSLEEKVRIRDRPVLSDGGVDLFANTV